MTQQCRVGYAVDFSTCRSMHQIILKMTPLVPPQLSCSKWDTDDKVISVITILLNFNKHLKINSKVLYRTSI